MERKEPNIAMDTVTIAGPTFHSRLFVGTGKYRSFPEMARCHAASGAKWSPLPSGA